VTKNKGWRRFFLWGILILLFIGSSISIIVEAQTENQGKITAIVVEGNENISKDLILSQVASNLGDLFSKENIERDMKAIYDLGYFEDVQVRLEPFRDGYKVVFTVVENLPIREINIQGNTAVSVEEMREVMILREGQVFCHKILKNDLDRIAQLYKDKGFLLANVQEINFDDQGRLSITLSEGVIEEVLITGNEKTKEKVIRREIKVEPGDIFDFNLVKESLQNIYNLGFFEDVTMKLAPGSKSNLVILTIEVVEKSTGVLGGGIGYGFGEGLFGYLSIAETNLFGGGQSLKAEIEVGAGKTTTYRLSFNEPWLADTPTFLGLSVYNSIYDKKEVVEGIDSEYEEHLKGAKLTLGRRFENGVRVGADLETKDVAYELVSGNLPTDISEGLSNTISPFMVYDTRDDVFNPTEGWYLTFSTQFSGGALGGEYDYQKYDLALRTYIATDIFEEKEEESTLTHTINEGVLALRAMGGYSASPLPSFDRYEIGGVATIRGYDYKEFSGDKMLVLNAEYRFPLAENFQGAIFTDWGNAWDYGESINIADLKYGIGAGVRFDTPLGAIRIDYGVGEDREGQFYFSIGQIF